MAIAYDATSVATNGTDSSQTWNHTVTGSNTYLIVAVNQSSAAVTNASVTYNGVGMTSLLQLSNNRDRIFGLANPTTGTNSVVVSYSSSGDNKSAIAVSYTGVSATGQPDSTASGSGSGGALSVSTTVVMANSWLASFGHSDPTTTTAGANTTIRNSHNSNSYQCYLADSNSAQAAGSKAQNITFGANTFPYMGVISLAPYVASGPTNLKTLNGAAKASIKTINGVAIASVKTFNGVA